MCLFGFVDCQKGQIDTVCVFLGFFRILLFGNEFLAFERHVIYVRFVEPNAILDLVLPISLIHLCGELARREKETTRSNFEGGKRFENSYDRAYIDG